MINQLTDKELLSILKKVLDVLKDELNQERTKEWTDYEKSIYILLTMWDGHGGFNLRRKPKPETMNRLREDGLTVREYFKENEAGVFVLNLM